MSIFQLQAATLAARTRTGDAAIGTRARNGQVQIVRVSFDASGNSTVCPLSGWMPVRDCVVALAAI